MKKATEKMNLFGKKELYWGINFLAALLGINYDSIRIGFPNYQRQKLQDIMEKTLNKESVEILSRGFGINHPRVTQKEIAEIMALEPGEVSIIAHKAMNKLKASPYKGQIKALVPSHEELFKLAEHGQRYSNGLKANLELQGKIEALVRENQRLSEELKAQAEKAANADNEQESLLKNVLEANLRAEELKAKILELEAELSQKNRVIERTVTLYGEIGKELEQLAEKPRPSTIEELNLREDLTKQLSRFGISTIDALCGLTANALTRLGIGQAGIREIKSSLKEKGLSLRR